MEPAFGSNFFISSFWRRHRLTWDGWTSWSLQIDLREWTRSWRSAASFIISCLLQQETIFRRTVTVVFIDAYVLVFGQKTDYICVNRAPLFLYLYERQKNLEKHGAPVVNSSYTFYEEGRMPVPPPPSKWWTFGGYSNPQITVVNKGLSILKIIGDS